MQKRYLFSPHLEFASQFLDAAVQRRFAPWPPANFNREYACKQPIHIEIWQVLNRYQKRGAEPAERQAPGLVCERTGEEMEDRYPWEKGLSLSFFTDADGTAHGLEPKVLRSVYEKGVRVVELSFSHSDYFERFALHTEEGIRACGERIREAGLRVWSIHLPFSAIWDLSNPEGHPTDGAAGTGGDVGDPDVEQALEDDKRLVHAGAVLGAKVAVIHSSFEPIPVGERAARLASAKRHLKVLCEYARGEGVQLALENLPRTCLGNRSEELLELLRATGAAFLFDTNHSLEEENTAFLEHMLREGYCPVSLHISDYDFVDERHDVPGHGINDWDRLLGSLQRAGYAGPAMYEIRHRVSADRLVSLEEVAENIELLLSGRIHGGEGTCARRRDS